MIVQTIAGMKFRVARREDIQTGITWGRDLGDYVAIDDPVDGRCVAALYRTGVWVVHPGYMYDGASGPTVDDETNTAPACWHDIGYETMRKHGDKYFTRKQVDDLMYRLLIANVNAQRDRDMKGAGWWRRRWVRSRHAMWRARYFAWYKGLRAFAFYAAWRRKKEDKYRVIEVL